MDSKSGIKSYKFNLDINSVECYTRSTILMESHMKFSIAKLMLAGFLLLCSIGWFAQAYYFILREETMTDGPTAGMTVLIIFQGIIIITLFCNTSKTERWFRERRY